jgi:D-sedoheptulose 7-phosphate isomerase
MSTLDRLYDESTGLADYAQRYARYLSELLARLDCAAIDRVGKVFEDARQDGRTIFVIGNGGSASTASHFANDFGFGSRKAGGKTYRMLSLTDNVAFMSAAGNDVGYSLVFVEQLKTLMNPGDVVLAISASGNSPNIIAAVDYANAHGAVTIGLSGFDGGRLKEITDVCVHVTTPAGDYGPVEDVHLILDHLISSFLVRMTAGRELRSHAPAPRAVAASTAAVSAVATIPLPRFRRMPKAGRGMQNRKRAFAG